MVAKIVFLVSVVAVAVSGYIIGLDLEGTEKWVALGITVVAAIAGFLFHSKLKENY